MQKDLRKIRIIIEIYVAEMCVTRRIVCRNVRYEIGCNLTCWAFYVFIGSLQAEAIKTPHGRNESRGDASSAQFVSCGNVWEDHSRFERTFSASERLFTVD